jgi:hypothetical protein
MPVLELVRHLFISIMTNADQLVRRWIELEGRARAEQLIDLYQRIGVLPNRARWLHPARPVGTFALLVFWIVQWAIKSVAFRVLCSFMAWLFGLFMAWLFGRPPKVAPGWAGADELSQYALYGWDD